MVGATIGPYRVIGVIGRGGMGAVYAAEHSLLGKPAAIKVLLPELSQRTDIVQRFFNEARAATAIRHPGIVEIHDFGWTADGAAYIIMERLEGETLARRMRRGRGSWQTSLAIVRQIAGALGAAHAKGIVHRDLKPDNVYLVHDPEVPGGERIKLLDFGIAKLAGDTAPGANVTNTGTVLGTPTYMAPEQCRGVAVDHRADLYALGCVLFELCAGRPPFVGEGTGDILAAHIHFPPPSLASLGVELPAAIEQLIDRLLAKAPAARVQTAEELVRAIDAITSEPSMTPAPPPPTPPLATTPAMATTLSGAASTIRRGPVIPQRRFPRSIAIAAGAVIASATIAIVLVVHSSAPPAAPPQPDRIVARVVQEPAAAAPVPPPAPAPSATAPSAAAPASASQPAVPAAPQTAPVVPSAPATPPPPVQPAAPATIDVSIASTPPAAQILLAGKPIGTTPFHGTLPRHDGTITLVLHLAGHVDQRLVVDGDRSISERVQLLATPAERPSRASRDRSIDPFKD